jgi:pimeloyl-ACP methyl ester carboxylesterase
MITGEASGVPFVAQEPSGGARPDAPVVVAWHLLDAPRTERAFAAALPLSGLDAWRFYLCLPLSGARSPDGGMDEVLRRGYEDAVLLMHEPINRQAADEYPAVLAALRARFGLVDDAPVGLLGGSAGAGVAAEVLARGAEADAAVLVSPMLQLRPVVAALGRLFGVDYRWGPASEPAAQRMDYVTRAGELGTTPVRLVVGSEDDGDAFRAPARELAAALAGPSDLVTIEGMGHALAEEPGTEPAPRTPHAAEVDAHAVDWFRKYLKA